MLVLIHSQLLGVQHVWNCTVQRWRHPLSAGLPRRRPVLAGERLRCVARPPLSRHLQEQCRSSRARTCRLERPALPCPCSGLLRGLHAEHRAQPGADDGAACWHAGTPCGAHDTLWAWQHRRRVRFLHSAAAQVRRNARGTMVSSSVACGICVHGVPIWPFSNFCAASRRWWSRMAAHGASRARGLSTWRLRTQHRWRCCSRLCCARRH